MANPTTNFGWVMPTSTSLVTNLPADFNTFGQGVDTSLQYLLGGTTGQVLSKTSNTNMAFTWVTPTDQTPLTTKGDLFAFSTVDARLPVGANETRLVADSAQTLGLKYVADTTNYAINAKGDLLAGTAADTLAALTVGANNTVLTADSSTATGLKWATPTSGGMTSIASGSLTGSSVVLSSISSSYKNLQLVLRNFTFSNTQNNIKITANSITSYTYQYLYSSTVNTVLNGYDIANAQVYLANNSILQATTTPTAIINIFDYTDTTAYKLFNSVIQGTRHDNSTQMVAQNTGAINSTAAITSLTIGTNGNNFSTGTYTLYGVS